MAGFGALWPDDVNAALPEAYADPSRRDFITGGIAGAIDLAKRAVENSKADVQRIGDPTRTELPSAETGLETALMTMGGAAPWAKTGAVGAAGGKLPQKPLVASSELAGPYHELLEPPSQLAYNALHGYPDAKIPTTATAEAAGDVGGGVAGASGGSGGLQQAIAQAERRAAGRRALPGLPTKEQIVDGELFVPGPVASVHDVADRYMADKDFGSYFKTPEKYHELDPEHSAAIAQAFDEMKHAPNDKATKNSYDALVKETLAQYQAIKDSGLKITPTNAETYPYLGNPRAVAKDVADNNHMAFFKTDASGFGSDPASGINLRTHPMMQPSGETLNGEPLLNNDLFRIVHDYFGHIKNGYGFRAGGEDNAWRAHAAMYSDLARPAMTTETRGQNSWVNYGPHGEFNRTASGADTKYADQKVGLLPEWVMRDRGSPAPIRTGQGSPHAFNQYRMDKIGTGEGAAAYVEGAYSAENPKVHTEYRKQLSANNAWEKNGEPMPWHHVADDMVGALNSARASRPFPDNTPLHPDQSAQMVGYLTRRMEGGKSLAAIKRNFEPPVGFEPEWNALLEHAKQYRYNKNPGHTYELAIDHPPEKFIDWDKPLAEHPENIRNAIEQLPALKDWVASSDSGKIPENWTAGQALKKAQRFGSSDVSARLKAAGIPGVRYLDQQSRNTAGWKITPPDQTVSGKWMVKGNDYNSKGLHFDTEAEAQAALKKKLGKQTRNYVTFDAPRILKRYALPGAIGAGGFGSLAPREEQ